MADRATPKPTEAELAILKVLWERGSSTVREVLETLNAGPTKVVGYTTALKLLQIMADKDLVVRDESQRSHLYTAARPSEDTQQQLVVDLLERAFAGSAARLAMQALRAGEASEAELAEIRALLDRLEDSGD